MKRLTEKAEKRFCELDEFAFRLLAIMANSYFVKDCMQVSTWTGRGKKENLPPCIHRLMLKVALDNSAS